MSHQQTVQKEHSQAEERTKGALAEHLLSIGHESAPLFQAPYDSVEHGDLLYDENGLPK